ncbi:MAG: DUF1924 domain-containing protein [Gammaproteobacteria bacterium]|jgi:cytochrome c553
MKRQTMQIMTATILTVGLIVVNGVVQASVTNNLLSEYQQQGAQQPNPDNAKKMWTQKYQDNKAGKARSCATCHTDNLRKIGKHVRTSKAIEPLAPSINSERLNDAKKIEKWFKRNCKWTIGRECSPQEKSDFLIYILNQ